MIISPRLSVNYVERSLNKTALLGLWCKLYLKLQNSPGASIETHTRSHIGFTYHRIPRRANNIIEAIAQTDKILANQT
ncbi:MAG: hypothetical protein HC789_10455 [Microcoleus sp. CSU_2_2]|nr:hypothetical protein [Microcoleus sp. CSU_2_2]